MVVSGFGVFEGLFTLSVQNMFGSMIIFSIILLLFIAILLASMQVPFELTFTICSLMAIGLAYAQWMQNQNMVIGIIIVFTAMFFAWLFSRMFS